MNHSGPCWQAAGFLSASPHRPRLKPLNAFLEESILEISQAVKALPSKPQIPWENLNHMFYRLIREYRL